jgi:hypothetical protein
MSRVSKKESAHHNKVMELVYSDKQLTQVDRGFIFTNYRGDGIGLQVLLAWDFIL